MNIKKASAVFFSPTDSTKKITEIIIGQLPVSTERIDITNYQQRGLSRSFAANEVVIFAMPVYGGRVPTAAVETLQNFKGSQTPAMIVVSYGNRDYDDALLELRNLVKQRGFVPLAAAAFITEHSIMHSVATGRPDDQDITQITDFAKKAWQKLQQAQQCSELNNLNLKGHSPYKEYNGIPLKPKASKKCTRCGLCAQNCPAGAISVEAPNKTNNELCISCMRCIKVCPVQARSLNKLMLTLAEKAFAAKFSARKNNEVFI